MARPLVAGMRTLLAGSFDIHLLVEVLDGWGTWQSLKTLGGVDWVDAVQWSQTLDQPVQSGTVTLRRDANGQSLAPLLAALPLNNIGGTYKPLIYPSRRIRVKVAHMAKGLVPATGDYMPVFDGKIDRVAWQANPMTITMSDIGAFAVSRFIETPTAYAAPGGTPVQTVMQSIFTDWMATSLLGTQTIIVPVSPGWNIRQYEQDYASVMQAIRDLAVNQIGWDFRWMWQSDNTFKPTFWSPDRTKTTPDWIFGPGEYFAVTNLEIADGDIRNRMKASCTDNATGARITFSADDATSIAEFGVLYMEIQEASTSNIDSMTELQRLVDNALPDLSQPGADHAIETLFFYPVELGDLIRHTADGKRYDSDEDFAVVAIAHSLAGGSGRTVITTRGKPAGAHKGWLALAKPPDGVSTGVDVGGITGADPGVLIGVADGGVMSVASGAAGTAPVSNGAGVIAFGNPTPGGTAAGDLSGTYPNPGVLQLRGATVPLGSSYLLGDLIYASAASALVKLAGQITTTRKFLSQTGTGTVSAVPAWAALIVADIPNLPASIITSGVLAMARLATGTPDGTKFVRDDGTLAVPTGSGSSLPLWVTNHPDTPPSTAHTLDDEFDVASGGSLNAKWSSYAVGVTTAFNGDGKLVITRAGTGSAFNLGGIEQAVPASTDWEIRCKTKMMGSQVPYSINGLYVRSAGGQIWLNVLFHNGASRADIYVGLHRYSSPTVRHSNPVETSMVGAGWVVLTYWRRIKFVGGTLTAQYCHSGQVGPHGPIDDGDWITILSETRASFFGANVLTRVGLSMDVYSATATGKGVHEYFRALAL